MRLWLLVVISAVSLVPARPGEASVKDVLEAIQTAYELYQQYRDHKITLSQATTNIINAVNAAKEEIVEHIDAIAAAQAKACAKALIIKYESVEDLTNDNQQLLALDSIDCLAEIESVIAELDEQGAVDTLGFALNALGPIALLVQAHAGFDDTIASILELVESGNQTVIEKIVPSCWQQTLWGDATPPEIQIPAPHITVRPASRSLMSAIPTSRRRPGRPSAMRTGTRAVASPSRWTWHCERSASPSS